MSSFSGIARISVLVIVCSISLTSGFPQGKRLYRSLPSVSDNHYSEVYPDGTYKYAYTGENRYTAERRLSDGTVEGETVYVRPDGLPVKVHYFADSHGYRPKQEILYAERLAAARAVPNKVIVPDVVYKEVATPGVVLTPPSIRSANNDILIRSNNGNDIAVGNNGGGDTAIATPSVTAIVGPGGHADIRPQAIARTGNGNSYYGRNLRGGDTAIANPHINAIVGAGGSVSVAPQAFASTGSASIGDNPVVVEREIHRPVHHVVKEVHTVPVVKEVPVVREVVRPVAVPVVREVVRHVPVPVVTESRGGYVYAPPSVSAVRAVPAVHTVAAAPTLTAVHADGVVLVPPKSSYSYEYAYSSPDEKHPAYGQNRAYVNVRVNQ